MQSSAARNVNIGYDLSRFDKRRRVQEALAREAVQPAPIPMPRAIPAPRSRTAEGERTAARTKTAAKRGISAFSVFGYMAVSALMVLIVFSYVSLNELSIRSDALRRELTTLKEEAAVLQVQYERTSDLRLLETNAEALGMSKVTAEQVTYIDLSRPDYVVMAGEEGESSDFLAGVRSVVAMIAEYFE